MSATSPEIIETANFVIVLLTPKGENLTPAERLIKVFASQRASEKAKELIVVTHADYANGDYIKTRQMI